VARFPVRLLFQQLFPTFDPNPLLILPSSFDWFIKSRSTQDLNRRAQTLLLCLMKEAPEVLRDSKPNGTTKKAVKVSWYFP
jgi:hypothetical protein